MEKEKKVFQRKENSEYRDKWEGWCGIFTTGKSNMIHLLAMDLALACIKECLPSRKGTNNNTRNTEYEKRNKTPRTN